MHRINKFVVFLLLGSVLTSCILGIEDENFFNVEKTPDPSLIAQLNYSYKDNHYYAVKDTLWLEETVYLRWSGGNIYGYEVLIDGQTFLSRDDNTGFRIKKGNRSDGAYRLTITQFAKSGTGSLADKMGGEYAAYTNEYVLMIAPNTFVPEIRSIVLKDGTVQLSWKPYERSDFQAYVLKKYYGTYGQPGLYDWPYRQLQVQDQFQTTFHDTTYVGGLVWYELSVNNGGDKLTAEPQRVRFDYEPDLELTKISDNRMKLSWNTPPFHKNVQYYTVMESGNVIQDHISAEQAFIEFEQQKVFGEKSSYSLWLNAKVDEFSTQGPDRKLFSESLSYGKKMPAFHSILFDKTENAFYLYHAYDYNHPWPDGMYKLDGSSLEVMDSTALDLSTSSYPKLVLSADGRHLYLLYSSVVQKIDPKTLSTGESFRTGRSFDRYRNKDDFAVSNNGFIAYHDGNYQVNILDFATKTILLKTKSGTASDLSADGKYFINGSEVYAYNGSEFVFYATLPFSDIRYVRFIDRLAKVFIGTADKVVLYDIDRSIEYSSYDFNIPTHRKPHLDRTSMMYGVEDGIKMNFIHIETGKRLEVPVHDYGSYLLEGNTLFDDSGFGLKNYSK